MKTREEKKIDWEEVFDSHFFRDPCDLVIDKEELKNWIEDLLKEERKKVEEPTQFTREELVEIKYVFKHYLKENHLDEFGYSVLSKIERMLKDAKIK